jgi:hypothetical protein
MRIPTVIAGGTFLVGRDDVRGLDVTVGHATRSLREFACALDALDESIAAMDRAFDDRSKLFDGAKHGDVINLPDNWDKPAAYWRERSLVHAKAAALSLYQIRDALFVVSKLVSSSGSSPAREPALAALRAFDEAFPDAKGIRDSIAHATERQSWRAKEGFREPHSLALTEVETAGGLKLSDFMIPRGLLYGHTLELRISKDGRGETARLEITDATLERAQEIIQSFVSKLEWEGPGPRVMNGLFS